jgi:hypothetical protein
MHMIPFNVAALAVASIFYLWRAYQSTMYQRQRILRERVAYMLWMAAAETD